MRVNNVLPADGVNDAELVVSRGEKLVKCVAGVMSISAAGNVESKKRSRREQRLIERVSAHRGDGKRTGRLVIEPPKLIIGFQVEIERFGAGRQPRAQSVPVFPSGGLVESDALPVDVEGVHLQLRLRFRQCAGDLPGVIDTLDKGGGRIIVEIVWPHSHGAPIKHVQRVPRHGQRCPKPVESPADVCEIGYSDQALGAKNDHLPAAAKREPRAGRER